MRHECRMQQIYDKLIFYKTSIIICTAENIQYLTGEDLSFSSRPFYLLLKPDYTFDLFINELYKQYPIENSKLNIIYYLDSEKGVEQLSKHLSTNQQVFFDYGLTLNDYLYLRANRSDLRFSVTSYIEDMRVIKDEKEIDCLSQATLITDAVFSQLQELIYLPATELSIKHQIITLFAQSNVHHLNFNPIVATGFNTVNPHHLSKEVGIKEGESILIDIGCKYNGYRSDMTRMMRCGELLDFKIKEYFDVLKNIQAEAIDMIRPGVELKAVDLFVRRELKKRSLLDYYTHNLGHGIGLSAYEYPYINSSSNDVFQEGMVVTIGPGIYIDGHYGLRIEDVVHVQHTKAKKLSNLSNEWLNINC
ncbi:M24 family metallopeptidase [Bacillus ndiopicus]|uniref:M24 family metallopeptidase n=1 Tax=Bacillus ndiopicus TaxID=1347368 RepID=UPI0009DE936D|nr:Xaa-Pro peptidase family protein [Bacillus ndiopicus]